MHRHSRTYTRTFLYIKKNAYEKSLQEKVLNTTTPEQVYNLEKYQFHVVYTVISLFHLMIAHHKKLEITDF